MPKIGKNRCGCDCKNQTVEAQQGYTGTGTRLNPAPCCDAWPNGTPCRYAVIFECFHEWPLICNDYVCGDLPFQTMINKPFGVSLNEDANSQLCTIPSPLGLTFPVMELMRDCGVDITGGCAFTNKLYNNSKIAPIITHMAPSYLTDQYPNAEINKFPPYHLNAGNIVYHQADFKRAYAYPGYGDDTEVNPAQPSCFHAEDGTTLWELKIGLDRPTLEWTYDYVLNSMPRFGATQVGDCSFSPAGTGTGTHASVSSHRPRYVADAAWDLWGRNTMTLQNPEDWPSLRPKICVVALQTGSWTNPCETHADQCECCDPGGDLPFSVTIGGCSRLAGSYSFILERHYGAPPYCGVNEPTAPCGWFWATIGTGSTDCPTGTVPEWSGEVGFLIYCDKSPDIPYKIKIYCYRNDTACWVYQTDATITLYQCTCDGPFFVFELPNTISCCCEVENVQTNCCPDPIPSGLTATITSSCSAINGAVIPLTYNSTDNNWCGTITIGGYEWRVCQADATLMGSPYCPIQLDCRAVGSPSWLTVMSPSSNGDMTCRPFYQSASGSFSDSCQCSGSHTVTVEVSA